MENVMFQYFHKHVSFDNNPSSRFNIDSKCL